MGREEREARRKGESRVRSRGSPILGGMYVPMAVFVGGFVF